MHVVSRIINGLNNKKSTGLDEISVKILKYCGETPFFMASGMCPLRNILVKILARIGDITCLLWIRCSYTI